LQQQPQEVDNAHVVEGVLEPEEEEDDDEEDERDYLTREEKQE
jgi:hypothetical protein